MENILFRKDCVNFLYKNSFKVPQIFKNSKLYRTCVACTRGETWRIFGIELLKIDLIDSYVSVFEISKKVPFHSSLANNADIFLRRIKNKWLNETKIIFVFLSPVNWARISCPKTFLGICKKTFFFSFLFFSKIFIGYYHI